MFARLPAAFLLIAAFAGASYGAHAQFGGADPLSIAITPDYPRPYQSITITPESNLIDLSASDITIRVNGTIVLQGSGKESASATVGGPGEVTRISITAANNGETYTAETTIRPADVALVLEPQSQSHEFYAGGALVASEGKVRIIAVPDLRTSAGAPIPASGLVYTWRNGNQILQAASGIGKQVLSATAPVRYRDTTISVTVSSQDSSVVGYAQVLVSPVDPIVRIYEHDPLLGPRYERAIAKSLAIGGKEATFRAVPYHFGSLPTLTWSVNSSASQTGLDITVRPAGSGTGRALLSVDAVSTEPRQAGKGDISVTFGENRIGIFGL
jgi:hypothetical protein